MLTFEGADQVGALLGSLAGHRVLVVDNASTDAIATVAADHGVELLARDRNDGYGAAMNEAADRLVAAGATTLAFVTQDCRIAPDALALLVSALDELPAPGVVGPALGRRTAPDRIWSRGGTLRHGGVGHLDGALADRPDQPYDVDWLDGALLVLRAADLRALGGFRDDLFLYWEDVDLCLRARAGGGAVRCVPAALAWQEPSMAPPYLDARNSLRVLGPRPALVGRILARSARDALHRDSRHRAPLRLAGVLDGLTGRMRRERALVR